MAQQDIAESGYTAGPNRRSSSGLGCCYKLSEEVLAQRQSYQALAGEGPTTGLVGVVAPAPETGV